MYIRYFEIFKILASIAPSGFKEQLNQIGMKLKIRQNLKYISENKVKVIKKLQNKIKHGEKLNVAFFIYDETKWKCQSIYDLMEESEYFTPYIFVTKNCAPEFNFNYQKPETLHQVYNFFENKNMRVEYAYDFEKNNFIPFKDMNPRPDIIYYCHPWYIYKTQGPVMSSEYALTYYSSYSVPSSMGEQEWYLRFHQYIETQYVLNDITKNYFSSKMDNKGVNLKTVGHPILDYFYINKDRVYENKNYVIYAPHFSVDDNTTLKWGTFLQMGDTMLEWAKKHPEFNWVFKPHPCLKGYLKNKNLWSEDRVQKYWDDWAKIGQVYESGGYLDMFMESKAMITDCGSFKTEYFMTQKPQIFPKSEHGMPYSPGVEKINETCYIVKTPQELTDTLDEVLIKGNDYKKEERKKVYQDCGYENNYAAKNILDDIKKTLIINQ